MDEHIGEDQETRDKRRNMWKQFGRETKAGKMLFDLYKSHEPPKINYPKPKPKSQAQKQRQQQKSLKPPPPQATQIQYPRTKSIERPTNFIDYIPHKKNFQAIKQQYQKYRREYQLPAYRPSKRPQEKADLQRKFKEGRGGLPKGAEMPKVSLTSKDQIEIRATVIARLEKKQKTGKQEKVQQKSRKQQLNQLFDQICQEIQDRQKYLDQINGLDEPQLKERIKQQMISRVAQLQKITQLRKKQQ